MKTQGWLIRKGHTIDEALEQLAEKYLLPERVSHGYIVLFDPKTSAGELCTPQKHILEGKEIFSFNIGIGRYRSSHK